MHWLNARIRGDHLGGVFTDGQKVLVSKSAVRHTSIGPCWWVYDGQVFRQIAETFAGRDLYQLLRIGKPFSEQVRVQARFDRFWVKISAVHQKNPQKSRKTLKKEVIL